MASPHDQGAPPRWDLIDDQLLTPCRVWELRARRYRHPSNGKEGEFYYLNSRDWAVVVARTVDNHLIMVRQFRWGSDELSWELPGGIVDEGEDPVAAGLRELQEETGYVAESGQHLGCCSPNPAILNNRCHVIFADNVRLDPAGTDWDEHEEMQIQSVPVEGVLEWARQCQIDHALALVGLLYFQLKVDQR